MSSTERIRLPLLVETANKPDNQSPCASCIGACCMKGMVLPLRPDEAAHLVAAGTEMHVLPKSERKGNRPGWRREFYQLDSDCGNLETDVETGMKYCGDYENRPGICSEFKEGGFNCEMVRAARNVPAVPQSAPSMPQQSTGFEDLR